MAYRGDLPNWTSTLAGYGALGYLLLWALCILPLFGYEEQWTGPDEAFYTLASMNWIEGTAYIVARYVLTFPAWPPSWFGVFSTNLPAAPLSGAMIGGATGWFLDRRARAAV